MWLEIVSVFLEKLKETTDAAVIGGLQTEIWSRDIQSGSEET
jgi:hypothetical protein